MVEQNKWTPAFYKVAKPKKAKPIKHEHIECVKLADYLRDHDVPFTHIANERKVFGKQGFAVANALQKAGVSKGFPDYMILTEEKIIFIEMKRAEKSKANVKEEQLAWLEKINSYDYAAGIVCYGFEEAKAYLVNNCNEFNNEQID